MNKRTLGALGAILVAVGGFVLWKVAGGGDSNETPAAESLVAKNTETFKPHDDSDDDDNADESRTSVEIDRLPDEKIYSLWRPFDAPVLGNPSAPLIVQIFNDFECDGCEVVVPIVQVIERDYSGKVFVVWRHYPSSLSGPGMDAHEAALEVYRQGGAAQFWKMHQLLLENRAKHDRASLERYASGLGGIDLKALKSALDTKSHQARIESDAKAIENIGLKTEPPTLFIQGRLFPGKPTVESVRAALDAMIRRIRSE